MVLAVLNGPPPGRGRGQPSPSMTGSITSDGRGLADKPLTRLRVEGEDVIRLDMERYRLSLGRGLAPLGACHDWVAAPGQAHMQQGVGSELFDQQHLAPQFPRAVSQVHVLWTYAKDKLTEACPPCRRPGRGREGKRRAAELGAAVGERDGLQIHGGRTDEPGDELVHRVV